MGMHLSPTMDQLRKGSQTIISRQVNMRQSFYDRNGVPVIRGPAFVYRQTHRQVSRRKDHIKTLCSPPVLARFDRPVSISIIRRIFDSDTILDIKDRPSSITVYGAGVIGTEYASMFRNLGCKVNLVNTRDKLLEFLDDEIIDALSYHLRDQGVIIRHNEEMESIEGLDDGVILTLKSGKRLKSDILLWANGRSGNIEDLGLDKVGLPPNSRGHIAVNEHFQTSEPHIYAVGDVIGYPSLASAAYTQGRAAAMHLLGEADDGPAVP
jgi:NAD(P) transhydrogenase